MAAVDDGHSECRVREFARWNRVMLEHERAYLSRCMTGSAFLQPGQAEGLLHDITDIDYLLQEHEKRIQV